jgi:hypothetical protein
MFGFYFCCEWIPNFVIYKHHFGVFKTKSDTGYSIEEFNLVSAAENG